MDQRYPKSCRLLDSKAFEFVFDSPDFRVSNRYFLILGRWTKTGGPRLGIIVAKKHLAHAVQRNRIKRLVREAFRVKRASLASADLVVLARGGLQLLENSECQSYIHDLMAEIERKTPPT